MCWYWDPFGFLFPMQKENIASFLKTELTFLLGREWMLNVFFFPIKLIIHLIFWKKELAAITAVNVIYPVCSIAWKIASVIIYKMLSTNLLCITLELSFMLCIISEIIWGMISWCFIMLVEKHTRRVIL